ncbi:MULTISPECIES: hypothetical protein [unclassified Rhizobium]|uniref:DUF4376 domain-containing protein n=1 Tax=unclassified Rhizobium TaxID=2613769 RepID=UPI00146A4E9E|nr:MULTISPECIES: hypothetical protein [unclassified Rhizobium]MBD9445748.1 hypothetical protein [Rhizobium sp. RHZ01]NMN73848.1 hypothetical protein [Rhizobium sp. 57MFTsu3.2]
MFYCKVENGVVTNRAVFDEEMPDDWPDRDTWHQDDEAQIGWAFENGAFVVPTSEPPTLDDLKASKESLTNARVSAFLNQGAPVSNSLHVALDDSSRADMGAMATTALAAAGGAVPWPDSYVQGWISIENTRIPLPTPSDGLALAAGVGDYYARIRQNGRTLKDAVMAAATEEALAAVDLDSGWPITN